MVHGVEHHDLGTTGLDGTELLPEATAPPIRNESAIAAMRAALLAQPQGTAWLVATGTLTNVALLFAVFPDVVEHIKGLSIMGGAIGGGFSEAPISYVHGEGERIGNWTRWAEFNIYVCRKYNDANYHRARTRSNFTSSVTRRLRRRFSQTGY